MRRILAIVVLLALITPPLPLPASREGNRAFAQTPGYELTTTPPESGMLAVGTAFVMNVLDAPTGQWREQNARVDYYVIWINPPRPPEYQVSLIDVPGAWFILNRATIDAHLRTP